MKLFVPGLIVCLCVSCSFSHAATVTQTRTFSGGPQTGSGTGGLVLADGTTGLVGTQFNPFNGSLGTLDSFQVVWSVSTSASGTVSSTVSDPSGRGFLFVKSGGIQYIGSDRYGGSANTNTVTGLPNETLPLTTATFTGDTTWLPANAGATYNPALLATVTGASDFNLVLISDNDDTAYATYGDLSGISADLAGSVTMTYTYTAAVPEPSTWMLGLGAVAVGGFARLRRRTR